MNLIFNDEAAQSLQEQNQIVLHLDRFTNGNNTVNVYLPLTVDNLNIDYLNKFAEFEKIHIEFREAIKQKSWQAAVALASVLKTMSGSELATYYEFCIEKIPALSSTELPENWDGTVYAPT